MVFERLELHVAVEVLVAVEVEPAVEVVLAVIAMQEVVKYQDQEALVVEVCHCSFYSHRPRWAVCSCESHSPLFLEIASCNLGVAKYR